MRLAFCTAVLCLGLAGTAVACPASYVTGLYNQDAGTNGVISGSDVTDAVRDKAGEVADGYMRGRGLEPNSPSGDIIRPYLGGTAIIEDYLLDNPIGGSEGYSHIDLDDPTDQIVAEALGDTAADPIVGTSPNGGHGQQMDSAEHFVIHFGDGVGDADDQGEVTDIPPPPDKKGG